MCSIFISTSSRLQGFFRHARLSETKVKHLDLCVAIVVQYRHLLDGHWTPGVDFSSLKELATESLESVSLTVQSHYALMLEYSIKMLQLTGVERHKVGEWLVLQVQEGGTVIKSMIITVAKGWKPIRRT